LYEQFLEKFALASKKVKVGDGTEVGVKQGPLIDQQALDKVQAHVANALEQGARLMAGGKPDEKAGLFFEPTILADVNHQMLVMREETFGPVAAVMRFSSEDEVIAAANDTDFGLAAYFYSRDIGRVWRVAEKLEYGMVGVNTGLIANEVTPFGGVKQSGLGREGSKYGMDEYLEMKYVCLGGM
jgi:succinate-semialdehyde dehydrogenase/glutarate-semialdehyde dehydrogenase